MTVNYALMDPTGNVTVLIETPVPPWSQPAVAAKVMALEPRAEQAGFLSRPGGCDVALRMAGGEFCGNAAMSAAARFCSLAGRDAAEVAVRVSGADGPVGVEIARTGDGLWRGAVDMPRPLSLETAVLPGGKAFPLVTFPGISHVILEETLPKREAEALAKAWCGLLGADALGLMFLDRQAGTLRPLVYVPAADTLFWESACGSGSSAVGAWLAEREKQTVTVSLKQPGGALTVTAVPHGPVTLQGYVRFLEEKTASIEI